MATHSSAPAWRIPGTAEPGGLQSMGLHRVGHDWNDLAAAAEWWLSGARRRGDSAFLFDEYKVSITQDKYIIVLLYNIVSWVNNAVWYTQKLVRG